MCTRVYGEYISGIFCILDDSVRLEYSMVPLSMLQFYNILHLQNILRIPYIRNIPWLFHVSNILLVISSFYIKEILFFFSYFSFITSWRIFWRTLLSFLCFLKLISLRVHLLFHSICFMLLLQCQEQILFSNFPRISS